MNYIIKVLSFMIVLFSLCTYSYSLDIPSIDLDTFDEIIPEDINITGRACYGCVVSLFINNELHSQQQMETQETVINWNSEPNVIEMTANQKFRINYTPSTGSASTVYELEVFDNSPVQESIYELSDEYTFSKASYDGAQIFARSSDFALGGGSKVVYFKNEFVDFYFDEIEKSDFISGQNTVKIVVSAPNFEGAQEPIEQSFTVNVEKYSMVFELNDENTYVANATGAIITGRLDSVDNIDEFGFAYLANGPGEIITNTGLMRNFEVNTSDLSFRIEIPTSQFREGENTLDLIGYTKGNRGNFVAFKRLNITRDSEPPEIVVNRIEMIEGGDVKSAFIGNQITNTIFTGYSKVRLNISVDAETLTWEYDSNPEEKFVVNNTVELDFTAKQGDQIVRDISQAILRGKTTEEILNEIETTQGIINNINQALAKLQEDDLSPNSEWYKLVADEYGIGHNLILRAEDLGGNKVTKSYVVLFNDEDPELIIDEMQPSSIFKDTEVFHNIQYVSGKTNQPLVDVSFLVITPDDYVVNDEGNRIRITCSNAFEYFEQGIWRNYEDTSDLDNSGDGSAGGSFAVQFADIFDIIRGSLDFTSDSNGAFGSSNVVDAVVSGESLVFRTNTDLQDEQRSAVHQNELCAFLRNKYGRVNDQSFDVDYLAGNYDWDIDGVTFNQNSINPYEIESSTGEAGGYRTGVVIEMTYTGQFGSAGDLDFSQVQVRKRGSEPRDVRVVSSEVVYFYESGTLNLFVPLEFSKREILISEYPDTESIVLEILPRAVVEGYTIDTTNPEFVDINVYYDKELTTKWLTPKMIDKGIAFLNLSKKWTGTLRNTTKKLVPVGVMSCLGAKFWFTMQTSGLDESEPEDKERIEQLQQQMFMICDRTYCSAAPNQCNDDVDTGDEAFLEFGTDGDGNRVLEEVPDDLSPFDIASNQEGKRIISQFNSLDVGAECTTPSGRMGRYVRGEVMQLEEDGMMFMTPIEAESTRILPRRCVAYSYDEETLQSVLQECGALSTAQERFECEEGAYGNQALQLGLNVNSIQQACYSEEAPNFDNTRCLEAKGYDPSDNIIESVRCGCIPETYQHLNKMYKIQENIQECLEDVKTAEVEGTYCERLISVSVCDAVTGIIFNLAEQSNIQRENREYAKSTNSLLELLGSVQASDELLQDRYEGSSLYTSGRGMNTQNIANSLCLFAINKDFAAFETALVGDLETSVEVDPSYTFTMPQSRFESYNPITGDMTISYKFTHNGISGGSSVQFTYELVCDSSKENGEYCPEGVVLAEEIDSSTFKPKRESISAGGEEQKLIEIRDIQAIFAYNVLRSTVEYTIGDEQKRYVYEEKISRGPFDILGSGAFSSCSFNLGFDGAGISCGSQFGNLGDITYYTFDSRTHVVPKATGGATLYPGNMVGVAVYYQARGDLSGDRGTLWYKVDNCGGQQFGEIPLDQREIGSNNGFFYKEIFSIPGSLSPAPTGNSTPTGISQGSCELQLRMTGSDVRLTADTFDLNILEENGIQTDTNTEQRINDIYTTRFGVSSSPNSTARVEMSILQPSEGTTICVNQNGVPIGNGILIGGTSGTTTPFSETTGITVELELKQYSQEPLQYTVANAGYQSAMGATYSSGIFTGVDFSTQKGARILLKYNDEIIERHDINLQLC